MHRASIASFQAVGYEYAVEMTYPDLPEGTSGGLVNFTSQVIFNMCHTASVCLLAYNSIPRPHKQHVTLIEALRIGPGIDL